MEKEKNQDLKYLNLAIKLAQKANPAPNPRVGCVIVKGEKIISQGYHKICGQDHAEIIALKKAKNKSQGATLYASLEPCSSYGQTPPCTDAILKAGIKKVIIASQEINPKNNQGLKILAKNKIETKIYHLKKAQEINPEFNKYIQKKLPFAALKIAQSLDGKIALTNGESQWITNEITRKEGYKLRNKYQAILTSSKTVFKDNPRLTARIKNGRDPLRIILDADLKLNLDAKVFQDNNFLLVISEKADKKNKLQFLKKFSANNLLLIKTKNKQINLKSLMQKLAQKKIASILVEAGGTLNTALIKEKLIDKIYCFIAPKILGGEKQAIQELGFNKMQKIINLKKTKIKILGDNILVEGEI